MPGPPQQTPIGLRTTRSARLLERAFNEAMAAAGGSAPMWSILIACKSRGGWNQNELAASIGIRGATLTHHLAAMEGRRLISRRRDPDNRRVHIVELTDAGEQLFLRLRDVATGFDRRLRQGIPAADREVYERVLNTMINNIRRPASAEQSSADSTSPSDDCDGRAASDTVDGDGERGRAMS